jgi:hypothetical protein
MSWRLDEEMKRVARRMIVEHWLDIVSVLGISKCVCSLYGLYKVLKSFMSRNSLSYCKLY